MTPSLPSTRRWLRVCGTVLAAGALAAACAREVREQPAAGPPRGEAIVTATAYTSHPEQTDGDPFLAASGERLEPGMRALAVSEDLYRAGLDFGTRVRVEGMPGEWVVLDRMPSGRARSIDLYFGLDEQAAQRFGKQRVRIDWRR
jgi:3D (Asp-Asp-Asp) domain-containing protein